MVNLQTVFEIKKKTLHENDTPKSNVTQAFFRIPRIPVIESTSTLGFKSGLFVVVCPRKAVWVLLLRLG
jgi:hypothetical protein